MVYWFKTNVYFAEWVDYAYWWSRLCFLTKDKYLNYTALLLIFTCFPLKTQVFTNCVLYQLFQNNYRDNKYTSHKKICVTQKCTNSRFVRDRFNLYKKNMQVLDKSIYSMLQWFAFDGQINNFGNIKTTDILTI